MGLGSSSPYQGFRFLWKGFSRPALPNHPGNVVARHYHALLPNSVERIAANQKRIWGKSKGQGAGLYSLFEIRLRNHKEAQPAMFDPISVPHLTSKRNALRSRASQGRFAPLARLRQAALLDSLSAAGVCLPWRNEVFRRLTAGRMLWLPRRTL